MKEKKSNFWRINNLAELIGIIAGIVAVVSIWLAIASLNMSKESLDLTKESIDLAKIALSKSDQQDSLNRLKDSLFFISDTTYKGELKRIQDKQQKLFGSLVNLTNEMIEEKRYTDRPIIDFTIHSIKVEPSIIQNSQIEYALAINLSCKNQGIRDADSLTIVQYVFTSDYNEMQKTIFGPFSTFLNGEGPQCVSYPLVGINKLNKMKSVILYLHATWYDKAGRREYSRDFINSFELREDGIPHGIVLNVNDLNRVKELIKK